MSASTCRVALLGVGCVGVVWLLGGWGGPRVTEVVSAGAFFVLGVSALAVSGVAARRSHGRRRIAMVLLAAGLAGWVIGDAVSNYQRLWLQDVLPFPSLADAGYLALPIAVGAAVLVLPIGHAGTFRTRLLLDGVIVAGSVFLVSWVVVLRRAADGERVGLLAEAAALAYPLLDVAVVTIIIVLLIVARPGRRATLALLLVGILLMAASNIVLFYLMVRNAYERGDALDAGWVASLVCFGLAATYNWGHSPADSDVLEAPSRLGTWLPYVPLVLAAVAGSVYLFDSTAAVVLVVAFGLVAAILSRQFLALNQNRQLATALAQQVSRDGLTGLLNRRRLVDRIDEALHANRRPSSLAVLSISVDHFRLVNDDLGRSVGDAVLIQIAERLTSCVPVADCVARLDGDEFAVFVEDLGTPPDAAARKVLEAFDSPFTIGDVDVTLRPSIGVGIASQAGDLDGEALLNRADTAMRIAKAERVSAIRICDTASASPSGDRPQQVVVDQPGPEGDLVPAQAIGLLRRAIEQDALTVVYQPQFSLPEHRITGVEALVRWPQPDGTVLLPDRFLPLARRHGLMSALGDVVVRRALNDAELWHRFGFDVPVAVNTPATSLTDAHFGSRLASTVEAHGLPASALVVELTEDFALTDMDRVHTVLNLLSDKGIRVSIDDFGTAYSALNYLRDLPFDELKLDQTFISPLVREPRAAAIVEAVIALAHQLGVAVVAEGVEDADTAQRLTEYGCDTAQGYFFSPPLGFDQLLALLAENRQLARDGVDLATPTH